MTGVLGIKSHSDYSPSEAVPSTYFNRKIENFMLCFSGGSIPSCAGWTKWEAVKMPWACDVVQARAWCYDLLTGGSIDFYEGGSSILSAPIAMQADTHKDGTIADASIAADAELSMRVLVQGNLQRVKACVTIAVD